MLHARSFMGDWWLPAEPERRLTGTLSISEAGIDLELLGAFGDEADPFEIESWPRIAGLTTDGKPVTLEQCDGSGTTVHIPGLATTRFRPRLVLVGAHYEPDEEVVFDELRLRFSDLDEWATVSGLSSSFTSSEDGQSLTEIGITYRPPETIEIPLLSGGLISLAFGMSFSGASQVTTTATITQRASVCIRFANPAALDEVYWSISQLRNFLAFAVGRPVRLLEATGVHDSPQSETADEQAASLKVGVMYRVINPVPPTKPRLQHEMLFTLASLGQQIGDVLNAWWDKEPALRPVFNLYFGTMFGSSIYLDHRFLSYIQALETYHRRTSSATELPKGEHRERIASILESSPTPHRAWLKTKLDHSNELTLAQRLGEVLALCPPAFARLVGDQAAQTRFIQSVTRTRNYRTHFDKRLEKKAAEGVALACLTEQLQALIECALLVELGFQCDEITAIFDRVRRFELVDRLRSQAELIQANPRNMARYGEPPPLAHACAEEP